MLAAAVLILALDIRFLHRELRDDAQRMADLAAQSDRAQRVMELLTSRTSEHVLLTAEKPSARADRARGLYRADRGTLIFQANNLKLLSRNRTYELWVIPANGAAPIPAGLFRPDATGSASVGLFHTSPAAYPQRLLV